MPKCAGGIRKKRRTHKVENEEELKQIPKSFVIKRGKVTTAIKDLVIDWRHVMSPYSAMKLKDHQSNKLKDFISVSSVFGVTHLMLFTQSSASPYWKIAHLPAGPSLTFRIHEFSLCKDVRAHQQKPRAGPVDFLTSPLVVLHGFRESSSSQTTGTTPLKLISTVVGHMFPVIEINSMKAQDCRRVVLFHYDKATKMIDVRHYTVMQRPAGISKNIKKLIRCKSNPNKFFNLGNKKDVSDFVLSGCGASESEGEEGTEVYATETQQAKGGITERSAKLAISLQEIGPRMKVQLIKIEEEVFTGKVLFHDFIKKTAEELAELEKNEEKLKNKRNREEEKLERIIKRRRKMIDVEYENIERKKEDNNGKQRKSSKRVRFFDNQVEGDADDEDENPLSDPDSDD